MTSEEISTLVAKRVLEEIRRQLPEEIERHRRNPYRRDRPDPRGDAKLPVMQFDHKVAFWVGCHQDQHGKPLVCIGINGQIVPIAAVDDLDGLIKRYRAAAIVPHPTALGAEDFFDPSTEDFYSYRRRINGSPT